MNLLKRGVRFTSQETDTPMLREEVPLVIMNLTPRGLRLAAAAGFGLLQARGYSINRALELLGDTPKGEHA
jgi:hypothetical protein